ncbi:RING finger protein 17-like isoform X2 [Eriocheir sinensis]|uniref:RING finger protein 17-like isoform X2 n=1 Tax=Eriocheir sinensis TaxID=95602 RepID=UPI0021C57575|nr:RING finger protein 17-like isoform X2 [Eriocheir sinensis]
MDLTQVLAQHLHGLLQLREQEALHNLHTASTSLRCDLAMKGAKLEADISERIEILNEGRRALITEEDTWHAGKLLEEIRKLLGGDAKGGAPCCGDEDRLKKEEQQEEEEEEDEAEEETEKEETVDDIARRIPVSFDVSSILKTLTEQFSAPSVSQYIPSINKDVVLSSSRSPEEAISDGRLTPAHLQVPSGPLSMATKLQRSPTLPHDTIGASSLLMLPEREESMIFKPQAHYSLATEPNRTVTPFQGHPKRLTLPLDLPEDLPIKNYLPFKGSKGNFEMEKKQKSKRRFRRGRKTLLGDPLQPLLIDSDPLLSMRGNRANLSLRGRGKLQDFSDTLGSPFQPILPAADSSAPSDMSDNDTVLLDASEDSSTKDSTQGFTTEEDTLQEKLTPDIIPSMIGWRSKGAVPKTSRTPTKQADFNSTASPPLPLPSPITTSSQPADFNFLSKPPPPLPQATAKSSVALDLNIIKTVPPPALYSSSMGSRTFSTSSLQSSVSSMGSAVPSKKPLCIIDEEVEVTHIQTPSFFFVHTRDNIQKRKALSNMLYRAVSKAKKTLKKPPTEGGLYLGQFSKDSKWYRVEVKTVMKEVEKALVTYVDYGNKEVVSFARLRRCPPKHSLENEPALALACSLWEVEPAKGKDWDEEAIQIFAKLVDDTTLQFFLISYKTEDNITKCQVELRRPWKTAGISNDLPVSVREILVFLEYAVYTNKSPEDSYTKRREESFKRNYFLPEIPFSELDTEVLLSSVVSPSNFYLQIKSSSEHLNTLLADLEKKYKSPNISSSLEWKIYSPKIDMPCVAQYSGEMRWVRARVENLPGERMVDVRFVDYGNTERLWYHQLYKIMDQFLVLPIQAIPCKLTGITPIGGLWRDEDTQHMTDLCDVPMLKAMFLECEGEVCNVRLTVPGSNEEEDLDVGRLLVEDGRALPFGAYAFAGDTYSHELNQTVMNRGVNSSAKRKTPSLLSTPRHFLQKGVERRKVAQLKVLEYFVYLHMLLQENAEACQMYQEQLAKVCAEEASEGGVLADVGEDCVVEMSSGQLTRATVLSVSEQEVEVLLIDCGGIEKVNPCSVHPMPAGMGRDTVAPFYQVVSLVGVLPPAGLTIWPGVTLDYLRRQFASSKKFSIIPKGDPVWDETLQVRVVPVDLCCQQEVKGGPIEANKIIWVSMSKQLLSHGLALPARPKSLPKKIPSEGSTEDSPSLASTSCASKRDKSTPPLAEEEAVLSRVKEEELFPHEKFEDEQNPESEAESSRTIVHSPTSTSLTPRKWMPPDLPTTLTFTATASYVDEEGSVFLQPKSNAATIDFIRESQTLMFNGSIPSDEDLCWRPGDPVVAKFHLDKKWYRATVIKATENGMVKVTFVDYGNPESVKVQEIRTHLINTDIPIQCIKARLNNVVPIDDDGMWKRQLLDFMHLSLVDKECLVTLVERPRHGEVLKVNLKLRSVGVDVATFLVNDLRACRMISQPIVEKRKEEEEEEEESSHDVIIESEQSEEPLSPLPPPSPPLLKLSNTPDLVLPTGSMFSVQVTAIRDPAHVFIRPITSQESTSSISTSAFAASSLNKSWAIQNSNLDEFLSFVNKNPQCLKAVTKPIVGEVYLAGFSESQWFRAELVELDATTASLAYIDFGHTETVPRENIRECPELGRHIGRCARLVRLCRVEPPGGPGALWEAKTMKAMIECLMSPQKPCFLASVVEPGTGGVAEVDIYKVDSETPLTLAYSELVKRGIITLRERTYHTE